MHATLPRIPVGYLSGLRTYAQPLNMAKNVFSRRLEFLGRRSLHGMLVARAVLGRHRFPFVTICPFHVGTLRCIAFTPRLTHLVTVLSYLRFPQELPANDLCFRTP